MNYIHYFLKFKNIIRVDLKLYEHYEFCYTQSFFQNVLINIVLSGMVLTQKSITIT